MIHGIKGLASECKSIPNLVFSTVTKLEIKSSINQQVEKELRKAMEEKVKVKDRLSKNEDDKT